MTRCRYGVLGRGFGVYGYLPAVASLPGARMTTLERYRNTILQRPEIAGYLGQVDYVHDYQSLLDTCDALILAVRPADQDALIRDAIQRGWTGHVFLEKPMAATPRKADSLLGLIQGSGLSVAVCFSICETDWARSVASQTVVTPLRKLSIDWRFMAHHYRGSINNWKRSFAEGGGALRFYAIHFVALLATLGNWTVVDASRLHNRSEDEAVEFAVSMGERRARIRCDSRWTGVPRFDVSAEFHDGTRYTWSLTDPFDEQQMRSPKSRGDRRVRYLVRALTSPSGSFGWPNCDDLMRHLQLWHDIENQRGTSPRPEAEIL